MRTRTHIETAGLEELPADERLTKKQVRYLLAGTSSDGFIYGLFGSALTAKVITENGEQFLLAGEIVKYIKSQPAGLKL